MGVFLRWHLQMASCIMLMCAFNVYNVITFRPVVVTVEDPDEIAKLSDFDAFGSEVGQCEHQCSFTSQNTLRVLWGLHLQLMQHSS